jgi:hypothetical protein
VVSDQNNSVNHPIYVVDEDLGCCILTVNEECKEGLDSDKPHYKPFSRKMVYGRCILMEHIQRKEWELE